MHRPGLVTFDEAGRPSAAAEKLIQFLAGNPGEDGRVGNLVAVEMQDRQDRAVGDWIEELVGMPRRGERPGFRLAIADDAGNEEIGIVEHRSERMAEGIAQLPALVDGAGALRRRMAGNSTGKRKLRKELPQPGLIL